MENINRTKAEVKVEGDEDLWNVEQALDHVFPGWRQHMPLKNNFAKIQNVFRKAAVAWADQTNPNNAMNRSVQVPFKGGIIK